MGKNKAPVIVWFRLDLRISDNPALVNACELGKPVIPIYILPDDEDGNWPVGGATKWWLHHSLGELKESLKSLGMELLFFKGKTKAVLEKLLKATESDTIYWNRRYEPHYIERDKELKEYFKAKGIEVSSFNSCLLFEPWEVSTKTGNPYQVFTPFWKSCVEKTDRRGPLDKPKYNSKLNSDFSNLANCSLDDLKLLPEIDWDGGLKEMWEPGEKGAHKNLKRFLSKPILGYKVARDFPAQKGVSCISPHLHFGEISPHQIWSQVQSKYSKYEEKNGKDSVQTYLKEVGWREFAHHVLYHFPRTADEPLREQFKSFKWLKDERALKAWQKGMTGYPIVDAGMRELWHTGWMHNRVRMIVASFLTKDLLISWRQGAEWFWDTLVDADLASNTLGWQWAGGCGADAAPYFRIFNPITQGERFDQNGDYVRKWVPELSELPNKWLHKPFEAPTSVLESAGVVLGKTYPDRIVDHSEARKRALATLSNSKKV